MLPDLIVFCCAILAAIYAVVVTIYDVVTGQCTMLGGTMK